MGTMAAENHKTKALNLLRSRLCDHKFIFKPLIDSPLTNFSKLKFMISNSVTEACNNSILLQGPRGSGKTEVLDLVIHDLFLEFPDSISLIRLNGLLHCDDISAFKEIARQVCTEHQLLFSKAASSDDNSQFMVAMLKECGLAHKTVIFILDEFDLFAQGKQRLLYNLLDAMQSVTSQAVVIGISSRLDADQLLEKRVRSRFSQRKLIFQPPSKEDAQRLLAHVLTLPIDSSFPHEYAVEFNNKVQKILEDIEICNKYLRADSSVKHLLRFLFCAISDMDLQTGFLSCKNLDNAFSCVKRAPKQECIRNCSILELYILVCMRRLEVKEQSLCNFNSVMKEYKSIQDSFHQSSDNYARNVCLRAFEHLIDRELICFTDNRAQSLTVEYHPVKLLLSPAELHVGLKAYDPRLCPPILLKLMD